MSVFNNIYSFGPHCCPKLRLDIIKSTNNVQIKETQMFDYLMIDIDTIINILNITNINDLINISNLEIYGGNESILCIKLKNIYFESIHDLTNNIGLSREELINNSSSLLNNNENLINNINTNFIEKYIRRYHRFINLLQNEDNICFIHQYYIPIEKYNILQESFKKFTDKKILIISLFDEDQNTEIITRYENLCYLNYKSLYLTGEFSADASLPFLNWNVIFSNIENIYKLTFDV